MMNKQKDEFEYDVPVLAPSIELFGEIKSDEGTTIFEPELPDPGQSDKEIEGDDKGEDDHATNDLDLGW